MPKASTQHHGDFIRVTLFEQEDFFRSRHHPNVKPKINIVETASHKALSQYGSSIVSRGHYSKNQSFTTPLSKIGQSNRIKPVVVSQVSATENGSCPTSELPYVSQLATTSPSTIVSQYVANSEGGVKVLRQQRIQLLQQSRQALQVDTTTLIVLFHQPIILQIAMTSTTTTSTSSTSTTSTTTAILQALSLNATVTASNFGSFAGSDAAQGDAIVNRSTTGYYNSGNWAPQYVQLQLSGTYTVCDVYLNVAQTPNGATQNQLSVGLSVASLQLVTTMNGNTSNGQWLNISYNPCLTGLTPEWAFYSHNQNVMEENETNSLLSQKFTTAKRMLSNFITDTVINDGYMEHILCCGKECRNINERHRPIPIYDYLHSPMTTFDDHYNPFLITGSFAESLSVPPIFDAKCTMDISDCDLMYVIPFLTCDLRPTRRKTTLLVNTQQTHSGYCNLIVDLDTTNIKTIPFESISDLTLQSHQYENDRTIYFLPSSPLPQSWLSVIENQNAERHGPAQQINTQCITSGLKAIYSKDFVVALHCVSWPIQEWIERSRSNNCPSETTIREIVKNGCHLVPVAHATSRKPDIEWRYSFSFAELVLTNEMPYYTRKTYLMFKLLCKKYLENYFPLKTYHLKTILFWCCEEYSTLFIDDKQKLTVKIDNIAEKLDKLIERLLNSIWKQELPSYFIRTNNLFDSIDSEYFSASQVTIIMEKIKYLRQNPMEILFETVLEHSRLDYCLPFSFNIRHIFEPILKYFSMEVDDQTLKHDCEIVIEKLSISLFLEGKAYAGRKLLQTIWYKYLEYLPVNDVEIADLITEHGYYSLVHNQYQELLLDRMIHVQEELLNYFTPTSDEKCSSQNIVLLRSLGCLHYIKSFSSNEENGDIESTYFRKSLDDSLITTIDSQVQQIRSYLAYGIYLGQLQRYEEALSLLETAISIKYHAFNNDFITIYSLHKAMHPKDIQHLLYIYNAINVSTKTYIFYLLCRFYKFTGRYDKGCQALINLVQHIHEVKDIHIGTYLTGHLCLLYDQTDVACEYFIINLRMEFGLNSIFESSKTMIIFKASLLITTFIQLNVQSCVISTTVQTTLKNLKWCYHHDLINSILVFLKDLYRRVLHAACHASEHMSIDFQEKFHSKVVPGLLSILDADENTRTQTHSAAALVSFVEHLPQIIEKFEQFLSRKYQEPVQHNHKLDFERIVIIISAIADTTGQDFSPYYDTFMPKLKYLFKIAITSDYRMLSGKIMECISLIGLAVDKEKFIYDCDEIMQEVFKAQVDFENDDPRISYFIGAWTRICKILGKDFEQYLPVVMKPVLKIAAFKPEVILLDGSNTGIEEDSNWKVLHVGDRTYGIKTTGLEEKAAACSLLVWFAKELKENFVNYVEETTKQILFMIILQHKQFYFFLIFLGVRETAGESLPHLLVCAKLRRDDYVRQMWKYMKKELFEVPGELFTSLGKCIETLGVSSLTVNELKKLTTILDSHLKKYFERAEKRHNEDDFDAYILNPISDIIHSLLVTYTDSYLAYFDTLVPYFHALIQPTRSISERQCGLCVFDDVIQFTGAHSHRYTHVFLSNMAESLVDPVAEVRQAAAYGFGVMGINGGPVYARACAESLPALFTLISASDSRSVENNTATENAISAVTKIFKFNNSCVDNIDKFYPIWLSWLPIYEDTEETPHVYGYLCDLIEQNNPVTVGQDQSNIPTIIKLFCGAFSKSSIEINSLVGQRMILILKHVQTIPSIFQTCINVLTNEERQALTNALNSSVSTPTLS
ncbi:unnamed protein product [Rotaria magnacalcarata]